MGQRFEVAWEGELPAGPQEVWEAFTRHQTGWYWKIEYQPWQGGTERGLTPGGGGSVITWDPPRHFVTRAESGGDGFNELDYLLEPRGTGTHLRFTHIGVFGADYDRLLDSCRQHTAFYYHSLGEYLRHFGGRDAGYIRAEAPARSVDGGFARLRDALGVQADITVGDRVRLTPAGLAPIDAVVDYATAHFLGLRGADALYRFYGRDAWGMPVGLAHHLFAEGAEERAGTLAWRAWLDEVFAADAAGREEQ
ncbi:SRPBCC family protein [Nocardia sp. alder85J]|uniref:SRPBCC family protein n=1 Tax=Nocardia sp. alder85J TaxID=2862949 RepID=UPI001CD21D2C|nr:SRPBCC domain-containing protein [Nocardia sp. alder85J]MCX4091925.1 SRPBCC domain-containing protein [Nocardia sp. alder85J]